MPIADQLTVLIAEDDPQLLDLIATTFQVFGLVVIKAADGKEAWESLQKERVDIVVTDVRMPNATGIELLKWIRKKNIGSPKVFFMTGYSDYPWDEIFENGADGLFLKPF